MHFAPPIFMKKQKSEKTKQKGLNKKVEWSMENRVVRKEMRKPFYEKMVKAGCTFITYGVETPVKHLLEKFAE